MPASKFTPTKPKLKGLGLGDLYGITYDEDAIRSKFDAATRDEYAVKNKEYAMTENKFYDKLYGTQATALDTIRRNTAQAVATGASRGMQAANELSAILGLTQEGVAGATDLAQQRNLLKDQEAAAYTQNALQALQESNALRQAIGSLDSQNYASDIQYAIGEMDYYARLDQAMKQLQGMEMSADAQRYTADQNYAGQIYASDKALIGQKYTADQALAGQQALAQAQKDAANIDATTRKEIAEAQKTPEFNAVFGEAIAAKDVTKAVAHLMHYTNMSRKDAEALVKKAMPNYTWDNIKTAAGLAQQYLPQVIEDYVIPAGQHVQNFGQNTLDAILQQLMRLSSPPGFNLNKR